MKRNILLLFILCTLCSCNNTAQRQSLSIDNHNPSTPDWANTHRYKHVRDTVSSSPLCVFYGDSITEGWHNDEFFSAHSSIALGVSGMTTCQLLCRFRVDVINLHPKYVAIMCGANDLAQNIGTIEIKTAVGNIVSMCQLAHINGITPLVCSVTPCDHFRWRPELGDPSEKVKEFNELLKTYCKEAGIQYVDYYSALDNGKGGLRDEYTIDRCHLTDSAYRVLESIIAPYLVK